MFRIGLCGFSLALLSTCTLFQSEGPVSVPSETHHDLVERTLSSPLPRFPLRVYRLDDKIASLYRDVSTREAVLAYFSELTGSEPVALAILEASAEQRVPTSLAFALAWAESRYKTNLVCRNKNHSIDRGLFQLNSSSFPFLSSEELYDPRTNARWGLSYLRYCLAYTGNDVMALAIYNAGIPRVAQAATPASTYPYIEDILKKRVSIEKGLSERLSPQAPRG